MLGKDYPLFLNKISSILFNQSPWCNYCAKAVSLLSAERGSRTKWYWTNWYGQNGTDRIIN